MKTVNVADDIHLKLEELKVKYFINEKIFYSFSDIIAKLIENHEVKK